LSSSVGARLFTLVTKVHVAVFRATGGRLGSTSGGMAPTLLLNHLGAKSHRHRTTPLLYLERLWPRLVEMYSDYAVYQERTEREIPVMVLEPAGAGGPG
jgi:hypothetical protein